jgi:transcriptional regulator with XRE-family HTH domain
MSIFSENLKYLRMQQKLSQVNLAKELEISPSAFTMYEKGKRETNFELLKKISEYFEVDYNILLGEKILSVDKEIVYTPNQEIDDLIMSENEADYIVRKATQKTGAGEGTVNKSEMEMVEFLRQNPLFKKFLRALKMIDKEDIEEFLRLANKTIKK